MTLKTCKTVTDNNLALTNKQNKLTLSNQYVVGFVKFIVLIFCVLSLFNHKHIISEYNKNVILNYILKYPLRIQKLLRKKSKHWFWQLQDTTFAQINYVLIQK